MTEPNWGWRIDETVRAVDRRLAEVARQLKMLYYLNPLNSDDERSRFFRLSGRYEPQYQYNPLNFDRDLVRRELYGLAIERIADPILQQLYRAKRVELDQMLSLLDERGTDDFTLTSEKLYGAPGPEDLDDAHSILEMDPEPEARSLDADQLKHKLQAVIDEFRRRHGPFECHVTIRRHLASNAAAGERSVAIKKGGRFSENDAKIFGVHEIGWHVLTANNAAQQPLELFAIGLPGFLGAQEGGAIFAEYMSGALTVNRLRVLAGRTLAVHLALGGARFSETFAYLMARPHGFAQEQAFSICERAYRGGAPSAHGRWSGIYSKDGIYQRYFVRVFNAWLGGLPLDAFAVGKMDLDHVPWCEQGLREGVLVPPRFLPFYYEDQNRLKLTRVMTHILHRREIVPHPQKVPPPAVEVGNAVHAAIPLQARGKKKKGKKPRRQDIPEAAE
jgi:uncharacterized protein (TIGR02421 family)